MFRILLLTLALAVALVSVQDFYPDPNPDCVTPWRLLFHFEDSPHCNGGDYYLFVCQQEVGVPGSIFQEYCTSSIHSWYPNELFLPVVER